MLTRWWMKRRANYRKLLVSAMSGMGSLAETTRFGFLLRTQGQIFLLSITKVILSGVVLWGLSTVFWEGGGKPNAMHARLGFFKMFLRAVC